MTLNERNDMQRFINGWVANLSADYKKAWNAWLPKRDLVAKQMKLTQDQILWVTKREIAKYVNFDYRRRINMDGKSKQEIVSTKGTTKSLEIIANMVNIHKEASIKCAGFINEFDKRVSQTTTR